ncbi:glycosyltransferase family 39 protein [Porcipelethomonas sp.]|uniref:glycosyltransferase family 39 protein n=1 Tax=Porcipelethomonas sp. TaxID=2981675 RepID=UPI003EF1131F
MNIKTLLDKYKKHILFFVVLIIGILIRSILFVSHPAGLNQDEASIGYDTWALLKYGIDRNGYSFPVHFIAWGSGQNALYAYLSMPFVAIFGLNVFSIRIVNLIFSLLTIIAIFFMLKKFMGFKAGIIGMALTAIAPWNIMLSRWGLESNLFPAMFILSIWAFTAALENKRFLYLAAVLFALSMYSYGSSYLVITLFCLFSFIYIIAKKLIPLKTCIIAAAVFLVFAAPIYLFVIINLFGLDSIQLGFISIPHTYGERISSMSGVTLKIILDNIINNVIMQVDGYTRNSFPFYGCIYVISLPFCIYGIIQTIRKRTPFSFIMINAFVCSMLLFLYYKEPNINRVNAIYLPMIIFTAVGICELSHKRSQILAFAVSYAICFAGFTSQYFSESYRTEIGNEFYESFGDAIFKADELCQNGETIYVSANVNMPYIYTLFYTQPSPYDFLDTVSYSNPQSQFQMVNSYNNYVFDINALGSGSKGIYIFDNYNINTINIFAKVIYTYDNYSVAVVE